MRLPLSTSTLNALGRGLSAGCSAHRRSSSSTTATTTASRTAVLPGQTLPWRPPSRLIGLLERHDGVPSVLA